MGAAGVLLREGTLAGRKNPVRGHQNKAKNAQMGVKKSIYIVYIGSGLYGLLPKSAQRA